MGRVHANWQEPREWFVGHWISEVESIDKSNARHLVDDYRLSLFSWKPCKSGDYLAHVDACG